MADQALTPDQFMQQQSPGLTPDSYMAATGGAPGAIPGQADKNQAILDRMQAEQTPQTGTVDRFLSGAAQYLKPQKTPIEEGVSAYKSGDYGGVAKALARTIIGPAYDLGAGAIDQGTKAVKSAMAKRPSEAVGHAAAALLPGVGPMAADIADTAGGEPAMPPGQQVEAPHPPDVAGAAGKTAVAAGVPAVLRGAQLGYRAITKVDPTIAMVRVWRPTPSDSGFSERLPEAMAQIKANAPEGITGNESALKAIDSTIDTHQQAFEQWMNQARKAGVTAAGDPIVQATASAIPDTMWRERPAEAQAIIDKANNAYGGQALTVDQLDRLRAGKNAELDAFYDKAEGKQIASEIAGSPLAVVKAQVEALRDMQYKALDPQNQGAGPRQIKSQQGDVINLKDAALRRRNSIIGEKPVSAGEALKRGLANVADIPGKAITGKLGESTPINGPTDSLIRRAFQSVGDATPLPMPPGVNWTQPQLSSGSIRMPTSDTSGPVKGYKPTIVSDFQKWRDSNFTRGQRGWEDANGNGFTDEALHQEFVTQQALKGPSGRAPTSRQLQRPPIVTPPPADTSGIKVTTGEPLRAPVSRQLSQGPSQLPYNADDSPRGGPIEAVPVIGADGKVYYTTRPRYPNGFMAPPQ